MPRWISISVALCLMLGMIVAAPYAMFLVGRPMERWASDFGPEGLISGGREILTFRGWQRDGQWIEHRLVDDPARVGTDAQGPPSQGAVLTVEKVPTTVSALGSYRRGQRRGPWLFLGPDGEPDEARSGVYERDHRVSELKSFPASRAPRDDRTAGSQGRAVTRPGRVEAPA